MDDQRTADKNLFRQIGMWDLVNRLKRNADHERATVAKQHDIDPTSLPGFGEEVPWGNTTTVLRSRR